MTETARKNAIARSYSRSSNWIAKSMRLAIYLRDGFCCAYCGTDLHSSPAFDVTLDHLDPRVEEMCPMARRNPRRLVTACRRCNSSRADKPWREFATGGAIERIERLVRRVPNLDLARGILSGSVGMDSVIERAR